MTINKTCLLLGNTQHTLGIKKAIIKKKWKVISKNKRIIISDLKNIDLIITFNYRFILKKKILKKLKRPAINLHMSYLPYNKGAHPNFWSFVENSPKGVTIHEIDKGLDTGPIIYQKKIIFNINKKRNDNFFKTYQILIFEIKKLFLDKINQILDKKYSAKKQKNNGTFHYQSDLPIFIRKNWKSKITKTLRMYKKANYSFYQTHTNKIFLKKLRLSDVNSSYLSWFKDEQIKQYIKKKITTIKELKKYVKSQLKKKNTLFLGIFLRRKNIHIGNIKFDSIDKKNNFCWLGILIGNKIYRGKGIGKEAVSKSSEWLFKKKNIHAIFLIVKRKNKMAIKLYKNCQFKILRYLKKTKEYLMVKKNPYMAIDQIKKINNFKYS
tara:strand:- start:4849 stop:5988 length:1140 start_codon:yes stop_codon:yes gene_type:complete